MIPAESIAHFEGFRSQKLRAIHTLSVYVNTLRESSPTAPSQSLVSANPICRDCGLDIKAGFQHQIAFPENTYWKSGS